MPHGRGEDVSIRPARSMTRSPLPCRRQASPLSIKRRGSILREPLRNRHWISMCNRRPSIVSANIAVTSLSHPHNKHTHLTIPNTSKRNTQHKTPHLHNPLQALQQRIPTTPSSTLQTNITHSSIAEQTCPEHRPDCGDRADRSSASAYCTGSTIPPLPGVIWPKSSILLAVNGTPATARMTRRERGERSQSWGSWTTTTHCNSR